jgi:hypothetical protein
MSCDNLNKNHSRIRREISEWYGKTILFSGKVNFSIYGRDTAFLHFHNSAYKILFFADSTGCTDCKLRLNEWKNLIAEVKTTMNNKVTFIFCFQPKSREDIVYLLRHERFNYPVMIDDDNNMNKLNHFPKQPEYQCFLLDKDNKVILTGNPVYNPAIWKLYKTVINEDVEKGSRTKDNK